ncbi:NADH-ubiquinone oxidoreductase chain 6, partial [Lucilia cuprina]
FLGGILVLFIYVTSLASNEIFSFSIKLLFISLRVFSVIIITLFFIDKNILLQYQNLEIKSIYDINSYLIENSLSLNKLYNYPTNLLTILLINYLLITLIAVVKITKLFKAIHYTADINLAFNRVNHICRDDEEFIMDHTYLLQLD